jgi:copper(I)-binding protein
MRLNGILIAAATVVSLSGVAAAAPSTAVVARDAVIRPAPRGLPTTAAYVTLRNPGRAPVKLVKVTCACARSVAPHETMEMDGMMHMHALGAVTIPPKGEVTFAPGGMHLMVTGLKRDIRAGETTPMILAFDHGRPLTVQFHAER